MGRAALAPLPSRPLPTLHTTADVLRLRTRVVLLTVAEEVEEEDVDRRALDREFLAIATPAFIQFAAEPLARLVDAAYLGRLNAAAVGGAGAAIAAQYAVTKLCNDPLRQSTISLVAAGHATASDGAPSAPATEVVASSAQTEAVATALLLALAVGVAQGVLYAIGTGTMLSGMRVVPSSPMRPHACAYLRVCALGAPAATLWLALNAIFRGLGDTRTPLMWALFFTALNAALDPLFIFVFGLGAAGAAAGTALAQTVACVPLVIALQRALGLRRAAALFRPRGGARALLASLARYAEAGGLLLVRTLGKISAYTVVSREAARLGAVASAAHVLCFQLGVVTTQVCESAAVATQALLARECGRRRPRAAAARHVLRRSVSLGAAVAATLSAATWANRRRVVGALTTDPAVRAAMGAVLPAVLACQGLKGLVYPVSGALMGGLDWGAAAASMWAAQLACLAAVAVQSRGGARALSLSELWATFVVLFVVQSLSGALRVLSGTGPWRMLYPSRHRAAADDATEEIADGRT